MPRHHIVITGTGRTGTTFLIQLYTALGLPTGFSDTSSDVYQSCNAGMEWDIRHENAPYIIKNPLLCDYLDQVLEHSDIVIDHAIIPVRDLYSAAESRRDVSRRTDRAVFTGGVPGGLWHTDVPQHQEVVLAVQLHKIIFTLTKRDIPTTLLHFPRLIHEPEYLFEKLEPTLPGVKYENFLPVFRQIARPDLVHKFDPTDAVTRSAQG